MTQLEGKTAIIFGGTAGIGRGIAERFAAEGARVYFTGRGKAQLDEAAAAVGANGVPLQADISKPDDIKRVFAQIKEDGRALDAVVVAATSMAGGPLADVTLEAYNQAFDTNVRGAVLTVQAALPLLNNGASVILFNTLAAGLGYPGLGNYAASKAAVGAYVRVWAAELAPRGIRVNTLTPGTIRTPGLTNMAVQDPAQTEVVFAALAQGLPMKRVGDPSDLAKAALFLVSDDSAYITGTNLTVDGGQAL